MMVGDTNLISYSQQLWRESFERRHHVVPAVPFTINPHTQPEVIMAQVITLPARSNAIDYDEDTVLDVYESLLDAGDGEGVVIDEAQDSESKARVRCRTMGRLLGNASDERPAVKVRTHVVPQGDDAWLPVLSLKTD